MTESGIAYDYIVIGAGSAGCVVATRLSEDPDVRVLVLEAGGDDRHPDVRDPSRWPALFYGEMDWGYETTPQSEADGRVIHCPRAKMLGGCHSHNADAWVRGHPLDFERWAALGNTGWGWSDALRIYRKIEDWQGPPDELRGTGGPMYVAPARDPGAIARAALEAGREVGLPVLDDVNGPDMEGIGYFNLTIRDGERFSVADAYLHPATSRPNLTVLTHAEVLRLTFDGDACTGVEYRREGRTERAAAERETILSAGVIGSPRALLLSGVGPAAALEALGIPVTLDLPGVGESLQDHALLGVCYEVDGPLPPLRYNGAATTLWARSRSGVPSPDIQPVVIEFPFTSPELADRLTENSYAIAPSVVRPESRGSVSLVSADPAVPPAIDMGYLRAEADLDAMLAAVELSREIGGASAFAEIRKREIMPGPLGRSDMTAFVRQAVTTYFHPTSSCRMGVDDLAVVDPELRVRGLRRLRVADASIMPDITTGNTNAPSILIGEKCAEMVRA